MYPIKSVLTALVLGIIASSGTAEHAEVGEGSKQRPVADAASPQTEQMNRLLQRFAGQPGCSASVVSNGQVIFAGGGGLAVIGARPRRPIGASTRFLLASATKPIVSMGIFKLRETLRAADRNSPDLLDRSLSYIFPEWRFRSPAIGSITVRQLLTHTSGLNGSTVAYQRYLSGSLSDMAMARALSQVPPSQNGSLYSGNGAYYRYSNAGFAVLGAVIEKLSGRSLSGYLREAFFEPLGMDETSVHHPRNYLYDQRSGDMAVAYEPGSGTRWESQPLIDSHSGTLADGGMVSSANDMAKLMKEMEKMEDGQSNLLSQASLQEMFRIPNARPYGQLIEARGGYRAVPDPNADGTQSNANYAHGWKVGPQNQSAPHSPTRTYYQWHGGTYGGYKTILSRVRRERPACRLSISILCNRGSQDTSALSDEIESIYCP